jgi:hypothetical protein
MPDQLEFTEIPEHTDRKQSIVEDRSRTNRKVASVKGSVANRDKGAPNGDSPPFLFESPATSL